MLLSYEWPVFWAAKRPHKEKIREDEKLRMFKRRRDCGDITIHIHVLLPTEYSHIAGYDRTRMHLPPPFSRYLSSLRALNQRVQETAASEQRKSLSSRLSDVFLRTWHLGFTSFGGPPVHFQIFHEKFVHGKGGQEKWVDEQTVSAETSEDVYDRLIGMAL